MNRVTNSVPRNRSKRRRLQSNKGMRGRRSTCIRTAQQAYYRSLQYSYIGRKLSTRRYSRSNTMTINLFCRNELEEKITYSQLKYKMRNLEGNTKNSNNNIYPLDNFILSNIIRIYPNLGKQLIKKIISGA